MSCYVGAANENDREGVKLVLENMKRKYNKVVKMWADMGYQGKDLKNYIKQEYGIELEIVKRPPCRFWVHKDTPVELLPARDAGNRLDVSSYLYRTTLAA